MYEIKHRIRYSETDFTGRLSMQGLLRIFQDCSYLHAEDRGLGVDFQTETRCAWFLLSWCIKLAEPPRLSEYVTVQTYFYYMHGSIAKKRISMKNKQGEELAYADTLWGYVDTQTEQPATCSPELWDSTDFDVLPDGSAPEPRKIKMSSDTKKLGSFCVYPYLIDTNGHVNNVRFTELAMKLAGAEVGCRFLRAEFLRQAFPDSIICPEICTNGGRVAVSVNGTDGDPYAIFEFEVI